MNRVEDLSDLTRLLMVDFVQMKAFGEDPLILAEGRGIRVRDDRGRWYVDGLSGVFVSALGHGNQRVIEAATEQLTRWRFTRRSSRRTCPRWSWPDC